jgi:hypothetical protein
MPVLVGTYTDLLITNGGHVLSFESGKETYVPPEFEKECIKRGHTKPAPTPKAVDKPVEKPVKVA